MLTGDDIQNSTELGRDSWRNHLDRPTLENFYELCVYIQYIIS